jgi:multidrug efflux pump
MQQYRLNSDQLRDYYINTSSGASIPVSTIAHLRTTVVPESLNHFEQLNAATITAVMSPGITLGQALDTLKGIAAQVLPEGYSIDYAGQSRQFMQESAALLFTFFFALVIIFLALAALFESFRDPFIVLVSVPMSICGAMIFISLGIGNASLNIYTEVGLVTLIGLISKHGILIVQFANDLQREGKAKRHGPGRHAPGVCIGRGCGGPIQHGPGHHHGHRHRNAVHAVRGACHVPVPCCGS